MDGLKQDEEFGSMDSKKSIDKQEALIRRRLKESAEMSLANFSNPSKDVLTIAYALQCFKLSGSPVEFGIEHVLLLKTMEDMSKLRKQLLQLVFNQSFCGLDQEFSWNHGTMENVERAWRVSTDEHPLLLNKEELLGQAICPGWADRVAKRMRGVSASEGEREVSAALYQACMVRETVSLHRSLCSFSVPLTDLKPYYDPLRNQVFCWIIAPFGPHLRQLPMHGVPIIDDVHRMVVFAFTLLEGLVLLCLRSVRKFMVASPASILRLEASGQMRVDNLLNKLKENCGSCAIFREAWNENPRELHLEILDWFQEGFCDQYEDSWTEMHRVVLLDPKEPFPEGSKDRERNKLL